MVGHVRAQDPGGPAEDRLARASAMVNDAVRLLQQAMIEIKGEEGHGDDRSTPGTPVGRDQQPGGDGPGPY